VSVATPPPATPQTGDEPVMGNVTPVMAEFSAEANHESAARRLAMFAALYDAQAEKLAGMPRTAITITLPDGAEKEGTAWETTPRDIAAGLSKKLAKEILVANVRYAEAHPTLGEVVACDADPEEEEEEVAGSWTPWDLDRPLEGSCEVELLKFDAQEAKDAFWRSASGLLGGALEKTFGAKLATGSLMENGFFYDSSLGATKLAQDDLGKLEAAMKATAKGSHEFQRLVLSKEDALALFADNPFKAHLIAERVPDGKMTTAYRCGDLVDLSQGPHVPDAGKIKAVWVSSSSSAYWLGNSDLDALQRVTAVAFPSDKELKKHKQMLEDAEKYDHRAIGKQQQLFFFHPTASPGSAFWTAYGSRVYNKLLDFIKAEYRIRGFEETVTPNIFSCDLWKTSGHYQNYKEDMFIWEIEGEEWGMKPMNCPAHCEVFRSTPRSYRELPLRIADFGVLHRNEASGALTGLTRVRRFQQDDAHIFCREDQIKEEVKGSLAFLEYVYTLFGFKFDVVLSTRPKKALGSVELWDKAEAQLAAALDEFGKPWKINPGDGAFYGPKIDTVVYDALGRKHQCGTTQLDFNLPLRFALQYRAEGAGAAADAEVEADGIAVDDVSPHRGRTGAFSKTDETPLRPGYERPVMIHRAVLGSVERMSAILLESYKGKLPFWLSPRQVMVVPISDVFSPYARYIQEQLHNHGFYAEADTGSDTLNKKVRNAQLAGWSYQAVVGAREEEDWTVNLRERGSKQPLGTFAMDAFIAKLKEENMPTSQPLNTLAPWKTSAKAGEEVASVPAADEPAVNTLPPTGASSDTAEAVEKSRMENKMFDLGDKSFEEEVAGLDEDEAKAAEAIRRLRDGGQ
jgi:threonyl-tRNA synthetase